MINVEIDRERENIARLIDVERPVENGDSVNLDFSGSIGGELFDGGTAKDHTLVIGSQTFIPGFEEGMLGMKLDEERDITVTFPEDYKAEHLAGKEAVFRVRVNGIQVKELPEADDEFAQDVSEFDTIEEFRASIRAKQIEQAEKTANEAKEEEAIDKAVANAQVDIPDVMIENELDRIVNDFRYRLSMQGLSLESYLEYTGSDMDTLRTNMRDNAQKSVKNQLVLEAIGKAEGLTATEEEIGAKLDEYASRFGDDFKSKLNENDRKNFERQLVLDKTIALVVENAVEK